MEMYERLEEEFGIWAGVDNCVACSSGTAALHLALEALQIPQGSEIVIPDFTMVACARAAVLAGLKPVFVDCRGDLCIDTTLLEAAITERTKAIMAVHIYGRPCRMEDIRYCAAKYDLRVIEDLAECHGLTPHTHTDAACWSFYKNKIIAGEEGGIVAFDSSVSRVLAKSLRSLGFTENHDYYHHERGHNYRLANLLAEPILKSIDNYEENVGLRSEIVGWYDNLCPKKWRMPSRYAHWVYDLRIPGLRREEQDLIVRTLRAKGIQARYGFKPMHMQSEFSRCRLVVGGDESLAEMFSREVIYLPCHPGVTREQVRDAIGQICLLV